MENHNREESGINPEEIDPRELTRRFFLSPVGAESVDLVETIAKQYDRWDSAGVVPTEDERMRLQRELTDIEIKRYREEALVRGEELTEQWKQETYEVASGLVQFAFIEVWEMRDEARHAGDENPQDS